MKRIIDIMKKRDSGIYLKAKPSKLYLSDINSIIDVFKELSDEINIKSEVYSYEDIEDMRKSPEKKTNSLEISTFKPTYLRLNFTPTSISISSTNDTILMNGATEKIKKIIEQRQNKYFTIMNHFITAILMGAFVAAIYIGLPLFLFKTNYPIYTSLIFIIISYYCAYILYKKHISYCLNDYSQIIFQDNENDISFWERNKDVFITTIIATVIGGVFVAIVTIYLQQS
jgi:hypothetical protein